MIPVSLNFANLIRENFYLNIFICIYLMKLCLFKCLLVICAFLVNYCFIPHLSLLPKFPSGLDSTPRHLFREILPHLIPQARCNFYFLSTTIIHWFRCDIFISNYIRDHTVFIFVSMGRQRNRCNDDFYFQS